MPSTFRGRRRPPLPAPALRRAVIIEFVMLAAVIGAAWLLVVRLENGNVVIDRTLGVLAFTAGVAASILLVVSAWMSGNHQARRIAAAVGIYTCVPLLVRVVGIASPHALWVVGRGVAVLAVVGLLVLALRGSTNVRRDRAAALAMIGIAVAGIVVVRTIRALFPAYLPPAWFPAAADLLAWSGAGAVSLLLLATGVRTDRALLRRVGLAVATLAAAHALSIVGDQPREAALDPAGSALELAAMAMLLITAVGFLASSLRSVWNQQEVSRHRLAEAEAVMAGVAERDHELRNLVAGLSGAARVLTDEEAGSSLDGRRLLVAAGAELARLQRMLDGSGAGGSGQTDVAVGRVLRDLALMHRAGGLDVWVEVDGDPHVAVEPEALVQVLTNLLVNCTRHAPGAQVWLRACTRGRQVRIEVADNGPGLPPGATAALLRRGVRGPDSTGDGLGLAITVELVERHHGTFTLVSGDRGCTAVLDLPVARDVSVAMGA